MIRALIILIVLAVAILQVRWFVRRPKSAFGKRTAPPAPMPQVQQRQRSGARLTQALLAGVLILGSFAMCHRAPETAGPLLMPVGHLAVQQSEPQPSKPPLPIIAPPKHITALRQLRPPDSSTIPEPEPLAGIEPVTGSAQHELAQASADDEPLPAKTRATPTIYTGPRGGRYHYSSSGKKVYEKHK